MKKTIFIVPVFSLFFVGYWLGGGSAEQSPHNNHSDAVKAVDKHEVLSRTNHNPVPPIIINKKTKESLKDLLVSGGQVFFQKVFSDRFWQNLSSEHVKELLEGYGELGKISKDYGDSHRDFQHEIERTKLGLLKSMGEFYLIKKLSNTDKKRMISFHKNILNIESNIFLKREAFSNLRKIMEFKDEKEREIFLSRIDKRVLYLSELSRDEIIARALNEN